MGKFRIQGSIDRETNRVVRIQTFVPTPMLGDTVEEKTTGNYKQYGSVGFPSNFHHHSNWDHELRPQGFFGVPDGGHNSFGITISAVQPNACGDAITVPAAAQNATVPPVRVEAQRLADGVYHLAGGTHNSVAVEFADFVAGVEAPPHEAPAPPAVPEVPPLLPEHTH